MNIKFHLNTRKQLRDGRHPLIIREIEGRTMKVHYTGVRLREEDWLADKQRVSNRHYHAKKINMRIKLITRLCIKHKLSVKQAHEKLEEWLRVENED